MQTIILPYYYVFDIGWALSLLGLVPSGRAESGGRDGEKSERLVRRRVRREERREEGAGRENGKWVRKKKTGLSYYYETNATVRINTVIQTCITSQ